MHLFFFPPSVNKVSSSRSLPPLLSYLLPYLQATTEQSDGDESHGSVVVVPFLFLIRSVCVWWQPVLSWVPVLGDGRWSCLRAARLFCGLAGPAQPVSPHDDHRADVQYNLLGAVRPTHVSPLTSLPRCLFEDLTGKVCVSPRSGCWVGLGLSAKVSSAARRSVCHWEKNESVWAQDTPH